MATVDLTLATDVLQAVGALAAAVTALYLARRAERQEWRRRPDLMLHFDADTDDIELRVGLGRSMSLWIRLRVSNAWGRHTAHGVEVLVVEVRPRSGGPSLTGSA